MVEIGKETLKIELAFNRRSVSPSQDTHGPQFIRNEPLGSQKLVFDVEKDKITGFWDELDDTIPI